MKAASFSLWSTVAIHLNYLNVVFDFSHVSSYHKKWSDMET